MTEPLVSILLPHLRNESNDAALQICLDCLIANTSMNFELKIESVAERRDIYRVINRMARMVVTPWIIPWNTDVFAAPNWLEPLWAARDLETIASPVLVECGAIPVNDRNLERDFGRTPDTFQRHEFEAWARRPHRWKDDWKEDEQAWFFPSLIPNRKFLALGGFDTKRGHFPDNELDMFFWETWRQSGGLFKRVHGSYMYHLQGYHEPERGLRA